MFVAAAAASADRCFLLPAAACHRLPDRQVWCWFVECDPTVFFLLIQTRYIYIAPRGSTTTTAVVSHSRSPFAYYFLGNCGHARS